MKRIFIIIAAVLASLMAVQAGEITIIVEEIQGGDTPFPLATTNRIVFNGQTMTVVEAGDQTTDFELANVGRILFQSSTAAKEAQYDVNAKQINIYPNPAENAIVIDGLEAGEKVRIYSEAGIIKLEGDYNGQEFNVSALERGRYIVQAYNVVVRMIKK